MAQGTRIKDIATTATSAASDDFLVVDGATNGTRKIAKGNLASAEISAAVRAHDESASAHGDVKSAIAERGTFRNLRSIIRRGRSASLLVASDSTGNASDEWVELTLAGIAQRHPELNVTTQVWDKDAQTYLAPSVVSTSNGGKRAMRFTAPPVATTTPPSIGPKAAVTGDFGLAVKVKPADWTPSAIQILFRHGDAGDNNVFWIALNTSGTVRVTYNTNAGANGDDATATSTVAISGVTDGVTELWVGFTYDRDNGAGGSDFKFWTSPDGATFTQLGATVTKTTANLIRTNGAAQSFWLGGTGASFAFVGDVSAVRFLYGQASLTAGTYLIPENIDAWTIGHPDYQSFVGGQQLWCYNASIPGETLAYHTETPARTASIFLDALTHVALLCSGHNYGTTVGATYRAALDTALAAFEAAIPEASFACSTQNPQVSPRSIADQLRQDRRNRDMVWWAHANGFGCIRAAEAFGSNTATTIGADGVHPTAAGSALWSGAALVEWDNS